MQGWVHALAGAVLLGLLASQSAPLKPHPVSGLEGQGTPAGQQPRPAPPRPPLSPLPVTGLDESSRAELDGRTLSVRLSQPMPVRDLLVLLARESGVSIVAGPGVDGTFVGELKDVTLRQALDLAVRPFGLDYTVDGRAIHVFRRQPETRFFDVNLAAARRTASRRLGASSALPTGGGGAAPGVGADVAVVQDADVFDDLAAGVRTLLSAEGRFSVDRKAGLVQATDFPERLDRIGLYLEAVQQRLHREVEIQARVIEVELSEPFAAGIDWRAALAKVSPAAAARGVAGLVRLPQADVAPLLAALAEQGRVNVLASPRVVAMNNEPALMRVGTDEVVFAPAASGAEGRGAPHGISTGLTLAVVPQIAADGIVVLSLAPQLVERTGEARSRAGERAPIVGVRAADTIVRVPQGETIVLGGMLRDREFTVEPQGLAGLFRRAETRRAKTELVVLLTPIAVTPVSDGD